MRKRERDAAFTDFVHRYDARLARTAFLLIGDSHLAEDLLQSALATAYTRWDGLRDPGAAEAYVRRVMVTTQLTWWRRRSSSEVPTDAVADQALPDFAGHSDTREDLLAALAQLSARQRAVVVLRYFDDMTEPAVADVLGCSVGTVKQHSSRALQRLRELLGDTVEPDERSEPRVGAAQVSVLHGASAW